MDKLKSIKSSLVFWRVLKIASFLLGVPLFIHLVMLNYKGITSEYIDISQAIFYFALAGALLIGVVMMLVGILLKKQKFLVRALVVALVSFVIIMAPLAYFEFVVKKDFDETRQGYIDEYDYDISYLGDHTLKYLEKLESFNSNMDKFLETYNIEYEGKMYGSKNTDLTPVYDTRSEEEPDDIFLDGYKGVDHYAFGFDVGGGVYSMNGMYADGYIFSYSQAEYIFTTYYKVKNAYAAKYKDLSADKALENALKELDTNPNSLWNQYKKEYDYKRAYGDAPMEGTFDINGEEYDEALVYAKNYYISEERLESMVGTVIAYLQLLANEPKYSGLKTALNLIMSGAAGFTIDTATFDDLINLLEGFGLDVMGLLEGFSFYQSPTTYPQMFFIEDKDLREYAYAKYYATTFGAVRGSVLIDESDNPRVGEVTLDSSGSAPMSEWELKNLFKSTKIEAEYMPKFYPWFAIREELILFAGIIPATLFFAYLFAEAERRQFNKLINGGQR